MPLHVEQLQAQAAESPGIHAAVCDARELDLPDASVDAVLLFGPLYHLAKRDDRLAVIREAARILRPGGPLFAATIFRWSLRIDGIIGNQMHLKYPAVLDAHRPDDLRAELIGFGPHQLATAILPIVG